MERRHDANSSKCWCEPFVLMQPPRNVYIYHRDRISKALRLGPYVVQWSAPREALT